MKITKMDIMSLRFAFQVIGEIEEQTISLEDREKVKVHKQRLRKLHLLLMQCQSQPTFELVKMCQYGIPDDSDLAGAIRTCNPDITDEG